MALLVPFLIVAVVWSVASVFLFQTPPAQTFVTNNHNIHVGTPDLSRLGEVGFEPSNEGIVTHTVSQLSRTDSYGPIAQRILSQQFGPRSFTRNMGAPMMPAYSPTTFNQQGAISTAGQNDYLAAVSADGSFRWSPNRLPLRVYISDGGSVPGYRPEFRKMIADAFNEWCKNSHGLLSWSQVNNANQADIVCTWTNSPTVKPGSVEAGQTRTLVQTNRDTGEGRIVSAQISILTQFMGKSFTNDNMYKTCLHEVGHSLGLQGHSDVVSDIMYPMVNPAQATNLKPRDLNTIRHLYSVAGYTALNSAGSQYPEMGSVLPFTGGGGTQENRRSNRRASRTSNTPFGNSEQNLQAGDVQSFTGSENSQQTDDSGITPFTGSQDSQSSTDDGIIPFTGAGNQEDSAGMPFYGRRRMQQMGGNGMPPFHGRGARQFGGNGGTPLFGGGGLQQPGFGMPQGFAPQGFGGPQQFYGQGQQISDPDDDQDDVNQQWQNQGFQSAPGGPHPHRQGDWTRRAAMREFMRRQALQQNGFYN